MDAHSLGKLVHAVFDVSGLSKAIDQDGALLQRSRGALDRTMFWWVVLWCEALHHKHHVRTEKLLVCEKCGCVFKR